MTDDKLFTQCACVHSDAIECARRRDGLDTDDPHYQRRECECCCHDNEDEDNAFWEE